MVVVVLGGEVVVVVVGADVVGVVVWLLDEPPCPAVSAAEGAVVVLDEVEVELDEPVVVAGAALAPGCSSAATTPTSAVPPIAATTAA